MKSYIAHESCGYFERTIRVYVDKKLYSMPYAKCGVILHSDGAVDFYSYSTLVCKIDAQGWLKFTGICSAANSKHVERFLREYAPKRAYYEAKFCYEKDVRMNINTGEIAGLPA